MDKDDASFMKFVNRARKKAFYWNCKCLPLLLEKQLFSAFRQ
jgi:hypothetical protein